MQPGGRAPAPGRLATLQAFINTHYDLEFEHGADLLASPDSSRRWLEQHGLLSAGAKLTHADVRRLQTMREALRELAAANGNVRASGELLRELDAGARGASVEVRFGPDGPRFVAPNPGRLAGAIGILLAIAGTAMLDGSWARLKVCPGEDCGWAFYDHSRNQAGRWCSMSVCGSRAKARTHYQRRRGGG